MQEIHVDLAPEPVVVAAAEEPHRLRLADVRRVDALANEALAGDLVHDRTRRAVIAVAAEMVRALAVDIKVKNSHVGERLGRIFKIEQGRARWPRGNARLRESSLRSRITFKLP